MKLIPQSGICSVHDSNWYLSSVFILFHYLNPDGFSFLFSCFVPCLTEERSEKQLGESLAASQGLPTTSTNFVSVYGANKKQNKVICV